jgi:hypothetical protein
MFSPQEYIIGWCLYIIAVVGLLVVFWHITRHIPWFYFKQSLRLIVAALLLLPASVEDAAAYWAPAWIKGFLQLVFGGGMEAFIPIGINLLIAALGALLTYLLLTLAIHFYLKKWPVTNSS